MSPFKLPHQSKWWRQKSSLERKGLNYRIYLVSCYHYCVAMQLCQKKKKKSGELILTINIQYSSSNSITLTWDIIRMCVCMYVCVIFSTSEYIAKCVRKFFKKIKKTQSETLKMAYTRVKTHTDSCWNIFY